MSRDTEAATDELACKHGCGKTAGNPGALARHEQACEAADGDGDGDGTDASEESPEGFRADDMLAKEIPEAVTRASQAVMQATVDRHDYTPTPEDSQADAAAKALVRAKDGGKDMFAVVFGECMHDGCEYGCNGFSSGYCKRHAVAEGESADGTDAADAKAAAAEGTPGDRATDAAEAADATREAPTHDGMDVLADLLADDVPPAKAAAAVEAAESVDVPESWAGVYGGVLDRVASPAKAKATADALRGDGE